MKYYIRNLLIFFSILLIIGGVFFSLLLYIGLHVGVLHSFSGSVAELKLDSGVKIVNRKRFYGDCYRIFKSVPVVYQVKRPEYELHIAHGIRYWPQFFLSATTFDGKELELVGEGIQRVAVPYGGDMRRLQEARETKLTHQVFTLKEVKDQSIKFIKFEVNNDQGNIIGIEKFEFETNQVSCMERDGF